MSNLADLEDVVSELPSMTTTQRAQAFLDIMAALGWDIVGVITVTEAQEYLFNRDSYYKRMGKK